MLSICLSELDRYLKFCIIYFHILCTGLDPPQLKKIIIMKLIFFKPGGTPMVIWGTKFARGKTIAGGRFTPAALLFNISRAFHVLQSEFGIPDVGP